MIWMHAPRPRGSLPAQALLDGARLVYVFNEASGAILNSGPDGATYNIGSVSANVTRQVAGVVRPDSLSILGSITNGTGAPDYGHAQSAAAPNIAGNQTFSWEMVLKTPLDKNGILALISNGAGGSSTALSVDAGTGAVRADLNIIGQPFNSQVLHGTGAITSAYRHIVMTWDGTNTRGYYQGGLVYTVAIGPGGTGISQSTPGSAKVVVAGDIDFNNSNIAASIDFLAVYTGHVLTGPEVATHFGLSGA
jgi:hypothetical protein